MVDFSDSQIWMPKSLTAARKAIKVFSGFETLPPRCAAIIGILLPGVLMPLCKMDTMHCRAVMQPSMIILSGAAAVSALIGIIAERSRKE